MGAGVPTGGSDWTLTFFAGVAVAVGVAVGVAAAAVVVAAVCFSRGTRAYFHNPYLDLTFFGVTDDRVAKK